MSSDIFFISRGGKLGVKLQLLLAVADDSEKYVGMLTWRGLRGKKQKTHALLHPRNTLEYSWEFLRSDKKCVLCCCSPPLFFWSADRKIVVAPWEGVITSLKYPLFSAIAIWKQKRGDASRASSCRVSLSGKFPHVTWRISTCRRRDASLIPNYVPGTNQAIFFFLFV